MTNPPNSTLAKIKRALASTRLPAALDSLPPRPPQSLREASDRQALVRSFTRELSALRGQAHHAASHAQALDIVLQLLRDSNAGPILAWDDSHLPVAGLGAVIRKAGFSILDSTLPVDPIPRKAKLAQLGQAAAGLTGASAGLADTGTLALVCGPGRPRLASLLPPIHIALLPIATLLPDLPSLFAAHPDLTQQASNLVLITGPSRTADIELTPVFGVHGPKTLHVVLV